MPLIRHRDEGRVEPLGLLLLPVRLEDFALAEQARRLLAIPRVVALEPPRLRPPRFMRHAAPFRQAKRLKLPGEPRAVILYDPNQYPLGRAICARFEEAELWYVRPLPEQRAKPVDPHADLDEYDGLAQERAGATRVVSWDNGAEQRDEPIFQRLHELGVISSRPFFPGARIQRD